MAITKGGELPQQLLADILLLITWYRFGVTCTGWLLVVLGFNATLTAKVISWRSVTHMCFLAFHTSTNTNVRSKGTMCFCRGEWQKYARKKVRLNQGLNSQPPGHEFDSLITEKNLKNSSNVNQTITCTSITADECFKDVSLKSVL